MSMHLFSSYSKCQCNMPVYTWIVLIAFDRQQQALYSLLCFFIGIWKYLLSSLHVSVCTTFWTNSANPAIRTCRCSVPRWQLPQPHRFCHSLRLPACLLVPWLLPLVSFLMRRVLYILAYLLSNVSISTSFNSYHGDHYCLNRGHFPATMSMYLFHVSYVPP